MSEVDSTLRSNFGITDLSFLTQTLAILEPPTPLAVHEDEPVVDVLQLMKDQRLGCLVVINDEEKLSGIFTERDVLMKLSLTDIDLENTPVCAVMTQNPACEPMETSIAMALYKMSKGGFRHMPIVDAKEALIGIISIKDIMDFLALQLVRNLFAVK